MTLESAALAQDNQDDRLTNLPGSVVVVAGEDAQGHDALAVWAVNASGRATGAWVPTRRELSADGALARGLVSTMAGRALLGSTPAAVRELCTELVECAGLDTAGVDDRVVSLADVVDDLREARDRCQEALERARVDTRQKLAPLSWTVDIASTEVFSNDDVRRLAGQGAPVGAPAPSEALMIVAGLRWATAAWLETDGVRRRRSYLASAIPDLAPVPTHLASAMGYVA